MKKIALATLLFTAACIAARAEVPTHYFQNLKVVNLSHLTEAELNEIMQGHHPELAVEFPAQTQLPVTIFLKGDLINLVGNSETVGIIEIKQTFYARCFEEELMLSTNLTEWKPFLEFITGNASVGLSIQDGQPSISVGAETNRRV